MSAGFLKILFFQLLFLTSIHSQASELCQNPYESICSEDNIITNHLRITANLKRLVNNVRWEILRDLGYQNWRDYFNSRHEELGLIAPRYNIRALKAYRSWGDFTEAEAVPQIEDCQNEVNSLIEKLDPESSTEEYRNTFLQVIPLIRRTRNELLDITLSLGEHILTAYNFVISRYCVPGNEIRENRDFCRKFKDLKPNFLLAQRNTTVDRTLKSKVQPLLDELIEDLFPKPKSFNDVSQENFDEIEHSKLSLFHREQNSSDYSIGRFCSLPGAWWTIDGSVQKSFSDYLVKVFSSKRALSRILEEIYTPEIKNQLDNEFLQIKDDLISIIDNWNIPEPTKSEIRSSYASLRLNWPELPEENMFKRDEETGLLILDSNQVDLTFSFWSQFIDPELEIISSVKASYLPHMLTGKFAIRSQVNIFPYFMEMYKVNPDGVRFVLSHEAAHNIDYIRSELNQFEGLQDFYSGLFTCYSSEDSFRMSYNQAGEVFSDFLASEVMRKRMMEKDLPAHKHEMAKNSLAPACILGNTNEFTSATNTHPDPFFRISAVTMANPSVRKELNCQKPQTNFKNCGLE